jgi:hypothetical protein
VLFAANGTGVVDRRQFRLVLEYIANFSSHSLFHSEQGSSSANTSLSSVSPSSSGRQSLSPMAEWGEMSRQEKMASPLEGISGIVSFSRRGSGGLSTVRLSTSPAHPGQAGREANRTMTSSADDGVVTKTIAALVQEVQQLKNERDAREISLAASPDVPGIGRTYQRARLMKELRDTEAARRRTEATPVAAEAGAGAGAEELRRQASAGSTPAARRAAPLGQQTSAVSTPRAAAATAPPPPSPRELAVRAGPAPDAPAGTAKRLVDRARSLEVAAGRIGCHAAPHCAVGFTARPRRACRRRGRTRRRPRRRTPRGCGASSMD